MVFKNGGSGGVIVNVFLVVLWLGLSGEYVDYVVLKGVIDMLIIGLLLEVVVQGICVNCVWSGFIYIEMYVSGGESGCVDCVKLNIFMQCGGQVEEVVQVIVWLLSDKVFYVMGSFIDLVGGK